MSRRASRSAGSRARPARSPSAPADPLHPLTTLASRRGSKDAERALERWEEAVLSSPVAFAASAARLADAGDSAFTRDERWFLLSILADIVDDPVLGDACAELEERLDAEARAWPGNEQGELDDVQLRMLSPVYEALSDAWSTLRVAIEVAFLRDIGLPEAARACMEDNGDWHRALRDGEATLLGVSRIVLTSDDDPYGILLS